MLFILEGSRRESQHHEILLSRWLPRGHRGMVYNPGCHLEESHSGCGWEWGHSLAYSEFYLFSSISSNVIPHAQTPKCGGNQECGLRSPYSHLKFPQVATSLASREPARTVP